MNICFRDYTHITDFINVNRGKYSEAHMATIVKSMLDAEFASEMAVDHLMWQVKPDTLLGEWLVREFGSFEDAYVAIPHVALLFRHWLNQRDDLDEFGD